MKKDLNLFSLIMVVIVGSLGMLGIGLYELGYEDVGVIFAGLGFFIGSVDLMIGGLCLFKELNK